MAETTERARFSGKLGFIVATAASAVGLGNLWRFPYMTANYGGGLFVLIYIILALTFGMCLMMTEISIGRKTGKSCISAFCDLSKKHKWIGYLIAIVPMLIVPYYCVIGGWVTKYFGESVIGHLSMLAEDGGAFWWDFVTINPEGSGVWFFIFTFACLVCIIAGVQKGIEKLSMILLPALLIMIVGITAYEFTLPGIWDGVAYYLIPDMGDLNAGTFLGAVGQIFYSMSIAMGILFTYGSYMKKDVDIEKSSASVAVIDTLVAVLAGLMIIPATFILFPEGVTSQSMGLMFTTMPQVFQVMPGGDVVAPIFYLLVIFAALTSAVSLMETVASTFMDKRNKDRGTATAITAGIVIFIGLLCVVGFKGGMLFVDTPLGGKYGWLGFLDTLTNSILMPIVAILTCLFVGIVLKMKFVDDEIESSSQFRLKRIFDPMVKYVCPAILTAILIVGVLAIFGISIY